ncbi:MAG: endonuclease V [Planctomycetota bacterium]|nr:endonuclease V [Planctomycetota bacterium]
MRLETLHRWDLPIPDAKALQSQLASRVKARTPRGFAPRLVAGADMSHRRGSPWLYGAVVVLRLPDFEEVEVRTARRAAAFPYVPGYLSFREGPVLLDCFEKLTHTPDAVLFDAHGLAHPRRFGLACHLGLWVGVPSAGCAKSRFCGEHAEPAQARGARSALTDGPERIGTVMRLRPQTKPVYVSIGNRIALEDAETLVEACSLERYRLPEPTRRAHLAVNAFRRAQEAT